MKGLWTRTTTQHFPSGQLYLWHECHSWHNLAEFCEIHLHWLETILTSEQATCLCFRKLFQNERTRHKSRVYPSLFYLQHIQILQEKKKKLSHKGYSIAKPQRSSDLRADGSRHEGHGAEGGPSIRPGAGSRHGRLDPSAGSSWGRSVLGTAPGWRGCPIAGAQLAAAHIRPGGAKPSGTQGGFVGCHSLIKLFHWCDLLWCHRMLWTPYE